VNEQKQTEEGAGGRGPVLSDVGTRHCCGESDKNEENSQ
jgi:hypothetical protein